MSSGVSTLTMSTKYSGEVHASTAMLTTSLAVPKSRINSISTFMIGLQLAYLPSYSTFLHLPHWSAPYQTPSLFSYLLPQVQLAAAQDPRGSQPGACHVNSPSHPPRGSSCRRFWADLYLAQEPCRYLFFCARCTRGMHQADTTCKIWNPSGAVHIIVLHMLTLDRELECICTWLCRVGW